MRPTLLPLLLVVVAGCATAPPVAPPAAPRAQPTAFSAATSLEGLPEGWRPYRLARFKKPTEYRLVRYGGTVALQAQAEGSASGLRFDTAIDLREYPWLTWRWKVTSLIDGADNTLAHVEDSPARVVVMFHGGRDSLPAAEQINYDLALAIGGNRLPYATLMYIWENNLPEGAVIPHHLTGRIKMIVAASGPDGVGAWREQRVNVLADYRRAFGEEPPRVKAIGIMSDADNTGGSVTAYYGDIRFERQ